jgi:hypothetical protein
MIVIPKPFVVRDSMSDCRVLRGVEYWQISGGKQILNVTSRTILPPMSIFNMISIRIVMRKTP